VSFHCKHLLESNLQETRHALAFENGMLLLSLMQHNVQETKQLLSFWRCLLTKVNLELSPREEIAALVPSLSIIPNIVKHFLCKFYILYKISISH